MTESTKLETADSAGSELTRLPHLPDPILQYDISREIAQL
jgi:hypothetical protein